MHVYRFFLRNDFISRIAYPFPLCTTWIILLKQGLSPLFSLRLSSLLHYAIFTTWKSLTNISHKKLFSRAQLRDSLSNARLLSCSFRILNFFFFFFFYKNTKHIISMFYLITRAYSFIYIHKKLIHMKY